MENLGICFNITKAIYRKLTDTGNVNGEKRKTFPVNQDEDKVFQSLHNLLICYFKS